MRNAVTTAGPPPVGRSDPEISSSASLFSLHRTTSLTIALLFVIAVAAVYGIVHTMRGESTQQQVVVLCTCGMLVCTAIAVLLIGRYVMQRSLRHLEQQLRSLAREDRLEPLTGAVPDELRAVMAALSDYVDRVRERTDRLRLQKKELDIQMRSAEAQHRHTEAIIFSISEAVLVIDTFGELVLANAAAERLFGFRMRDWRFRPVERVIQDSSLVALIKDARSDPPGSRRQVEYSLIRDGRTQTFNIILSVIIDASGESRGVVAVFHDVTRDREIAQIKTDFVSAVSHELRTPLSSIRAYVEMLLDSELQDEARRQESYRIIDSEAQRLQRLIAKILDISRIESGVMEIHRVLLDPGDIVREVVGMTMPQARDKEMTLEFEPSVGATVEADRDLLYQAVQNVLTNGIKYTRRGGRVVVRTGVDLDAGQYTITVADNGMGIRAEDLPRVFDKFFRSRDSADIAKGTGLGLNLVKQIIETVHRGEISVASEHGLGTTMTLRLPLAGGEVEKDE